MTKSFKCQFLVNKYKYNWQNLEPLTYSLLQDLGMLIINKDKRDFYE